MSDIKKLAGQTAVYGIPTIVGRFLNYFLVPLYTYNIAASQYGMVSELYARSLPNDYPNVWNGDGFLSLFARI